MTFEVINLTSDHIEETVGLQALAFPPPFDPDLHWRAEHLEAHIAKFPEGQFIAVSEGRVIGNAANCLVPEPTWQAHKSWIETVGGPFIENHDPSGSTLYGLDIAVHPDFRKVGVGRALYEARYALVGTQNLTRYGTACRIPDYQFHRDLPVEAYVAQVRNGQINDRTLSPLLRMGLNYLDILPDYMEDSESENNAVLLEWLP